MKAPSLEVLVQAALAAPPLRREAALAVLRGELVAVEPGGSAPVIERYLTLRGLSRVTGFSVTSLWRWEVPSVSFGGRQRYRLSDVQKYFGSRDFERRLAGLRAERRHSKEGTRADNAARCHSGLHHHVSSQAICQ